MKTLLSLFLLTPCLWAQSDLVFPWVTNQPLFRTTLIVNNPNAEAAQVSLTATRPAGNDPGTEVHTAEVAPGGQWVIQAGTLFEGLGDGAGYSVRLTSQASDIQGGFVVSGAQSQSGASPAQANVIPTLNAAPVQLFNFLAVNGSGLSAPVVYNAGDATATVTYHAFQNGAEAAAVMRSIEAGRPHAETTEALFPGLIGDFFVVAESDQPILGVAFIFNNLLEPSMANAVPLSFVPESKDKWRQPVCTQISGTSFQTWSRDDGRSFAFNLTLGVTRNFSFGLVAMGEPNLLFATEDADIVMSRDAGCTWAPLGSVSPGHETFVMTMAGGQNTAYAYPFLPGLADIYRVSADSGVEQMRGPTDNVRGFGVSATSDLDLRLIGGSDKTVYASTDGGENWRAQGVLVPTTRTLNFAAVNPNDLDHMVVGSNSPSESPNRVGFWVTFDGGATWSQPTGFSDDRHNVWQGSISPLDGNIVWIAARNIAESDQGLLSAQKIYRSTDGGRSFKIVVEQSAQVIIPNGPPMFASGHDADVLYFTHADSAQSQRAYIYRYDAGDNLLTVYDHDYFQTGEVQSMAFNPDHPGVIYVGRTFQFPQ